ncbi:hypothetical protein MTR67_036077 [Solanum verrucosum]|uniref:NB-ARC domain-containing protein n=1 Tax=Solanum verrucosum TaxID=315347 RepID=A0AAF0ZKV3_SOLVR|nr:hypothetical protein MTR67_036077 [Solanum verrucosum]
MSFQAMILGHCSPKKLKIMPPGFEEIGKKIVEECRGLPIALPTIESEKDLTYWEMAATRLHSFKTPSIIEEDLKYAVIERSYSQMICS